MFKVRGRTQHLLFSRKRFGVHRMLNPRDYQPSLPIPDGYTKEKILEALSSATIDGSVIGEFRGYVTADCERFLRTLDLVPQGEGELLEIGGSPYFTTLLLTRFRQKYKLNITNFFNGGPRTESQRVHFDGFDNEPEDHEFVFQNLNIEEWTFPYHDGQMDVIVFGEVLEHMTNDPLHAIREINRVLNQDGVLILTTPNAARWENVLAFLEGRNIYDPYSAYGPYGRHNREYTRHELHQLLTFGGFGADVAYTANVHDDIPALRATQKAAKEAIRALKNREYDLGQYMFTRWRKVGTCPDKRPGWLYRSYPPDKIF